MMEKEEEEDSSGTKTQVVVHLQPIQQGGNHDAAGTGTTVLAVEAHHDDSEEEGEKMEYGYPITCGESRAVLLFKKFVCPGINVRCVKFNDQLISPKQFVHLAGKATLKDWKRAIRLGGVMLRKMMDSGQIDFYQHDTVCSNTCRSTKFDVLINSSQLPAGISVQPSPACLALDTLGGLLPSLTEVGHEVAEPLEDKLGSAAEWCPGLAGLINTSAANGHASKRKKSSTPDGGVSLWRCVADSGLMGDVLSSLQTEFLATLKGVEVRSEKDNLQETDAILLNTLCEMFGLLDSVRQAVGHKCSQNLEHRETADSFEGQRKKVRSHKSTASKTPQTLLNSSSQNLLPTAVSNSVIQPLSLMGFSATSYPQLPVNPHHGTHFSPSGSRYQPAASRDGRLCRPEGKLDGTEARKPEKVHRPGHDGRSGTRQDFGHEGDRLQQEPQNEKLTETAVLCGVEKVLGRKASKKVKTK
ncbi:glucocorticoid modulatory element-binding protein 1-like [Synchiropus splendidus]|uniref:glucocorticoid modulatory element-binding protein 1-like n=1 Tax=Synchiropus splendidus TaxID=270530 RepID=UPI00237D6D8A|nr:glucocorticoid modulatory element-binding protein 1-like [Synchiropus splendidus]XP_053744224.1 glucocorticoid modulatory element-binding protein 1-like [Synchiropus splendidus]